VVGDDAQPFEAKLDVVDGVDRWTCQVLRDRELDRVAELSAEGMSVRDIGAELNLSKSKIQRMQAKLRAEGRL
jgi:DNA-binding NarL/FixJ family response regulator